MNPRKNFSGFFGRAGAKVETVLEESDDSVPYSKSREHDRTVSFDTDLTKTSQRLPSSVDGDASGV